MLENEQLERPSVMARQAVSGVIKLQRRIFKRQLKIIEAQETHQTRGFSQYRNTYRKAVSGFIDRAGFGALCDEVSEAQIAFVADYHTLRLAQKTLLTIIKAVMQQVDAICIATEFVHEKYQKDLDRFIEGKIKEKTFLARIHYKELWPYDIWPNFKPVFELAKKLGFPMRAIDSDSVLPLNERDKIAAKRIAKLAKDFPDATIFVSAGQMHMAPSHLPAKVDLAFVKEGMSAPERVIVYQNAEEIYWQLAQEGREEVEVVKVNEGEYCVNNTPPLVQQLSYLHWIHYDEELIEYTQLGQTVRSLIKDLARFLRLDAKEAHQEVRVLMPGDLDLMDILTEANIEACEMEQILRQAEAEQSVCVPKINLIYLATLSVNHAAEEAAHYLKHVVSGAKTPEDPQDLFYFYILNEACAFFGSKVINPKRKADHPGRLRALIAKSRQSAKKGVDEKAAIFVLDHLKWERGTKRKKIKSSELLQNPLVFNAAAHFLGYILGDRLYYGLTDGVISKKLVRSLFLTPFDQPKESSEVYIELSSRLTSVKIPHRI